MKRAILVLGAAAAISGLVACGGDDSSTSTDGGSDSHAADAAGDVSAMPDSSSDAGDGAMADAAGDAGAIDSAGGDAANMDAADAGKFPLNGCDMASFVDRTAAGATRAIAGPMSALPSPWQPPCMTIKVGQAVTWTAAFVNHPLEPKGGDPGSPIMTVSTGTSTTVAFSGTGLFGFDCAVHTSQMQGAILVVP